ncbi:hypothetical protein [Marinifilum fragile]|uniref:hypothetical protein n=1 Tax=Marinifilum fragile TaxID=570161 RepID=UPI002AA85E08|nr:hypothetical protein [Marinifilum fragile]
MSDNLKEFIENDIVSIKQDNCNNKKETLLFTIERFENDKVYLLGIETAYSIEDLIPVALTDKAIKNINYRPLFMAPASFDRSQPKTQIPKKESLNNIFNNQYRSAIIDKYSIEYVHELQHVLIKKRIDLNIRITSPIKHIKKLIQTQ